MRGGETVGTAYVRILADGRNLRRSVREQWEKEVTPEYDRLAKKDAGAYKDGFDEELKKVRGQNLNDIVARVRTSIGGVTAVRQFTAEGDRDGGIYLSALRNRLAESGIDKDEAQRIAERIFGNLAKEAERIGSLDPFANLDIGKRFAQARKQEIEEINAALLEEQKRIERIEQLEEEDWRNRQKRMDADMRKFAAFAAQKDREEREAFARTERLDQLEERAQDKALREAQLRLAALFREKESATRARLTVLSELERTVAAFNRGELEGFTTARQLRHEAETLRREMHAAGDEVAGLDRRFFALSKRINRTGSDADNLAGHAERLSETIGTLFGKGARNNFFNLTGIVAEGLTRLTTVMPLKAFDALSSKVKEASEAFRSGSGFFSSVTTGFASLGPQLLSLAGGFALVAAGVTGLAVLLGPLAALISLLAASIVALAGSISFALVGALGALSALLLPVAAGLGVFVAGVVSLTKENKAAKKELTAANSEVKKWQDKVAAAKVGTDKYKLAQAGLAKALAEQRTAQANANSTLGEGISALKTWLSQTSKIAAEHTFKAVGSDIKTVLPTLNRFKTITGLIGDALSKNISGFGKALASKSFNKFLDTFSKFIPGIITKLGDAFNHLFLGLSGLFRALLPFGDRLAGVIDRVAKRFDDWINSVKGQSTVTKFMNEAWQSAKLLSQTLVLIVQDIAELFSAGRSTGDSFLGSINSSLERFNAFLKSDAGREALRKWFQDAKTFMGEVGHVLNGIVKLFDDLDTEQARKNLNAIVSVLGDLLSAAQSVFNFFTSDFGKALATAAAAMYIGSKFAQALSFVKGQFGGITTAAREAAVASEIATAAGSGGGIPIGGKPGKTGPGGLPVIGAGLGLGIGLASTTSGDESAIQKRLNQIGSLVDQLDAKSGSAIATLRKLNGADLGRLLDLFKHGAIDVDTLKESIHNFDFAQQVLQSHLKDLQIAQVGSARGFDIFGNGSNAAIDNIGKFQTALGLLTGNEFKALNQAIKDGRVSFSDLQTALANNNIGVLAHKLFLQAQVDAKKTKDAIDGVGASVGKVPKELKGPKIPGAVNQSLTDARDTLSNILKFKDLGTPKLNPVNIKGANADARELFRNFKDLDNTKASPKIDKNTFLEGKLGVDALRVGFDSLGRMVVTPHVTVAGDAKASTEALQKLLFEMTGRHYTLAITADVDTTAAKKHLNDLIIQGKLSHVIGRDIPLLSAAGRIVNGPTLTVTGEAGPEAIVPLNRPLSQVDPAVRWLSAIAQGKSFVGPSPGSITPTRVVNATLNVTTTTADPKAAAREVLNQLVAVGY